MTIEQPNSQGKIDTSYDALKLKMHTHPFIEKIIFWRTLSKMINTYLIPFTQKAQNDILHPSFWQYGKDKAIVTGRFSASDPSMQNIPKGIRGDKEALHALGDVVRKAVKPREGNVLMFFDYKQIEMAIFTCATNDMHLIKTIKEGGDIYMANAQRMFGATYFDGLSAEEKKKRRYDAKELSLSLIYGMGIKSFAAKVKRSLLEARKMRDAYFTNIPKARALIMRLQRELLNNDYVTDIFGRRYHVPTAFAYKAVNAYCQGTAATIMKRAIIKSQELKKYGAFPIITVHDELIFEVPKNNIDVVAKIGKDLFEEKTLFPAPLVIDVEYSDTNWAEKKKFPF